MQRFFQYFSQVVAGFVIGLGAIAFCVVVYAGITTVWANAIGEEIRSMAPITSSKHR